MNTKLLAACAVLSLTAAGAANAADGPMATNTMGSDHMMAGEHMAKGKMAKLTDDAKKDRDSGIGSSGETDDETDEEADRLERELDNMYDQYKAQRPPP